MPLLINEHSINPAQFHEIYRSERRASQLGEAMGLPGEVITEVRRLIRDEGLCSVKPDVVVQKHFVFGAQPIKTTRVNTMKTTPATQSKPPALTESKAKKPTSLNEHILLVLANAKTLLMPLHIQNAMNADRMECKVALAQLLEKGLINRVKNGKYTLSELGADTLTAQYHPVCSKACARISYYSKFPDQLYNPTTVVHKSTVKSTDTAVLDQEKQALSEMCQDLVLDDKPSAVDQELAAFEGLFTAELSDIPTKIKIINKVRSHFTGPVVQHLVELEQYLQKKAG
jgi:hypothetical protein